MNKAPLASTMAEAARLPRCEASSPPVSKPSRNLDSPLFQARHATLLSTEVLGDDVCLCYALGEGEAEGEEAASGE